MADENTTDIQSNVLDQQNDTAADSSTDTNKTDESTDSSTDDKAKDDKEQLPFNEHPRWKELLEKDKQRDAELAELRSFREQAEPLISKFQPKEEVNIPSWFGGDETAWKAYKADQDRLVDEAETRALKRIREEQESQDKRIKDANAWFESTVSELESTGAKVDRNKLLKTAMDYELVDTKGRWNYKAAYEILKRDEAPDLSLEAKRKAASATVSESKAEKAAPDYKVPRFMRRGL